MGKIIQLCVAGIVATCSDSEIGLSTCGLGLLVDIEDFVSASEAQPRPGLDLGLGVLASFNITGYLRSVLHGVCLSVFSRITLKVCQILMKCFEAVHYLIT